MDEQQNNIDDITEQVSNPIVGKGGFNSECMKGDYGKGIGVLYQQDKYVRIHNGRIIGCDGPGYVVKHCSDASTGTPFKFNTFHFYNQKYFRNHTVSGKSHAHAFIDVEISNSKKAIFYYGLKQGSKTYATHNGTFVSFTYKDPNTGKPVTSTNYDVFLSFRYSPSKVINLVYDHYVMKTNVKTHALSLQPERATAISVLHFGEIPYK